MNTPVHYIFIDGSYFCYHRYHSLYTWWNNANKEEAPLTSPVENQIFIGKFKKTFSETIQKLPKNLGINKNIQPVLVVAKDCRKSNIWRVQHYPQYKANRSKKASAEMYPFFKLIDEEELFQKAGVKYILYHDHLEADDCIALACIQLLKKDPTCLIHIITSDKDYLQLMQPRVTIVDLSFKHLADQKSSFGNAEINLFCKIIMGDPSDNIPSVFKLCGPVTAKKCFEDKAFYQKKIDKENPDASQKLELNTLLVDFRCIPEELQQEFYCSMPNMLHH